MNLLNPGRPKPMERMLVAYADDDVCHILCRRGAGIEEEDKGLTLDDLGCGTEPGPASGLWVYDVVPLFVPDHDEGYTMNYGSLEYDKGTFKKPSEREWNYIKNCDMEGLYNYWSDILSAEQWQAQLNKEKE